MPSNEFPDRSMSQASRRAVRRRRRRRAVAALIVLLAGLCAASGLFFIWPAQGMPAHVDAIVVLDGPGDRLGKGLELAHQGRAPVLVVSLGSRRGPVPASVCGLRSQVLQVICFHPESATTRGEAEFVGHLAKQYRWRSVVLVTTPDQDIRARIRFGRCFIGKTYVVTTPLPASKWPYQIAYQWAASFKAVVLQRSC